MKPLRNTLSPLGRMLLNAITYLLYDNFTTSESAPIASPRTCEPGPGTLTIRDTTNKISISSGSLLMSAGTGTAGNPGVYAAVARVSGTLFHVKSISSVTNRSAGIGNAANGSPNTVAYNQNYNNPQIVINGVANNWNILPTGYYDVNFAYVLRDVGCFILVKQATYFPTWTLAFVENSITSQPYICATNYDAGGSCRFDDFRAVKMQSPWNSDYGIAIGHIASPTVGSQITSETAGTIEQTWTAVTGQVWDWMFRYTDDNNCWIIRSSQSGGTIKIIEKNGGVETERASAAQTFTNGVAYRVLVRFSTTGFSVYVAGTFKTSYASTWNNSAVGVKTDRAGTHLTSWPTILSGDALTELNRWTT